MREPSASKLALLDACAHPFTSGTRWPWEESSGAAAFGNAVHAGIEASVTGEAVFPAMLRGLSSLEVDKAFRCIEHAVRLMADDPIKGPLLEFELRYDVAAGVARIAARSDPKRPGEWTVRIDYVGETHGGLLLVRDWKTGRQQYTADARANPQTQLGAVAAAKYFRASRVRVELVYLDEWGATPDPAEFDRFDLAMIAADMRARRRRITGGPTAPVPGPHCTQQFCPLRGICPATVAALAAVYPLEQPLTTEVRDVEHARFMLERLDGADAAIAAVRGALKEYARSHPVPMGDGKVYAWREKSDRDVRIETPEHIEALRRVLGDHAAAAVTTKFSATIGSIKDAAKRKLEAEGVKRGVGSLVEDALVELEQAGGLVRSQWRAAEIFKPREFGA